MEPSNEFFDADIKTMIIYGAGGLSYKYEDVTVDGHNAKIIHEDERDIKAKYWSAVDKDDVVVDIGANFGAYTLSAVALGAGMVYAFEPGRGFFRSLRNNLRYNGSMKDNWGDRCGLYKVGLWSSNTAIHYSQKDFGSHGTVIHPSDDEMINAVTLDHFMFRELSIPPHRIDWIKIDTEGSEFEILQGAAKVLSKYHPHVLIEVHNSIRGNETYNQANILNWLRDKFAGKFEYQIEQVGAKADTSYMFVMFK